MRVSSVPGQTPATYTTDKLEPKSRGAPKDLTRLPTGRWEGYSAAPPLDVRFKRCSRPPLHDRTPLLQQVVAGVGGDRRRAPRTGERQLRQHLVHVVLPRPVLEARPEPWPDAPIPALRSASVITGHGNRATISGSAVCMCHGGNPCAIASRSSTTIRPIRFESPTILPARWADSTTFGARRIG